MHKPPQFRTPLAISLLLLGGVAIIVFALPDLGALALLIGVFGFFVMLIVFQTVYAVKLFQADREDREKNTRPCPSCEAPVYPEDKTCPYCKQDLKE